jgi:Spy/CpxP family protein refolding chaperone
MGQTPSTAMKVPQNAASKALEERITVNWSHPKMRLSTLALSTLILAAPAAAFAQTPAPAAQGEAMHGFFTPEQREMYMEQQKANGTDWQSMSQDQRHAQMQAMRAKFEAMSDADKTKLRADMQAKFDALTPDQKQAVEQKIAERRAMRQQMMQNGGGQSQ